MFKPTFLTGYDSLTAGTGFVIRSGNEFIFITAHHLFGPAAGLERDLTPAEAKEFASALAASSMQQHELLLTSAEMLLIPSAKACDEKDAGHDIAAFRLKSYRGPSLIVSGTAPKLGDKVYLLARPRGEEKLRLIAGEIRRFSTDEMEYFYSESGFNFAGTSGAPVLNEAGEVVGMNLGGGEFKGRPFGFANPAVSFLPLVIGALKPADPAPQPQKPMPPPSIPNTVDYVETPSRDLPQTKAFFAALLGWRFTEYGPDYLAFEDGRLNGGFYRSEKVSSYVAGSTIVIVYTERLEELRDRAKTLGATITRDIFSFPGGRRFHFTEPGGSEFAAWSDK